MMKLSTLLAAFTGLGFVSASPTPPGLAALLKRGRNLLYWDPHDAHPNGSPRREKWEQRCDEAITREDCNVAIIHHGESPVMLSNGEKSSYVNVVAAPLNHMEDSKRMRVFEDGSSQLGWSKEHENAIRQKSWDEANAPKTVRQPPEGQTAHLSWNPADSYRYQPKIRTHWEWSCNKALTRQGCGAGIIHKGKQKLVRAGRTTYYHNVEGAPSVDMRNSKKMRVFEDGTSRPGWFQKDEQNMRDKLADREHPEPHLTEGQTAVVSWDNAKSYKFNPRRRLRWEQLCRQALIRQGCGAGIIYSGLGRLRRYGEKISYHNVQGAPSVDMKNSKKMRVFENGSIMEGWYTNSPDANNRKKRKGSPEEPSKAILIWDPENTYKSRPHKKSFWERRCDKVLDKEDCYIGMIQRAEHHLTKPDGTKTTYVNVEGIQITSTNHTKQLRVFKDGSYENGWSVRDRHLMGVGQRKRSRGHGRDRSPESDSKLTTEEASTSTQLPTEEKTQHDSKRRKIGPSELQGPMTSPQSHTPESNPERPRSEHQHSSS